MTDTDQEQKKNEAVEELFGSLLGLDVSVSQSDTTIENGFIVVYGRDADSIDGVGLCDLSFANQSGAALARIPGRVAGESTKAGECPENLMENFSEIMNVCSVLARQEQNVRLKMLKMYTPSSDIPDEVKEKLPKGDQPALQVSIAGYDPGLFMMCAT